MDCREIVIIPSPLGLPSNTLETQIDPVWPITFPRNSKDRPIIPSNGFSSGNHSTSSSRGRQLCILIGTYLGIEVVPNCRACLKEMSNCLLPYSVVFNHFNGPFIIIIFFSSYPRDFFVASFFFPLVEISASFPLVVVEITIHW